MLKKDLIEQNKKLEAKIKELEGKTPITKEEVQELIMETIATNLNFKQNHKGGAVSVYMGDSYVSSFETGEDHHANY